jgi:aminoglycoside phosphotransferase (APT) family kinase protein
MIQQDIPTDIRKGESIDLNLLNPYLKTQLPDFGIITEIKQFPGGYSNLTYWLKVDSNHSESTEYVLRRPPFGANIKSGHDMSREFRVLTMLQKVGYDKIPKPIFLESTGSVLNAPFYIMERLQGCILRGKDGKNPVNPMLTPVLLNDLCQKLVENLANLHQIDVYKTDLVQIGKPDGYVKRQIEGWIKRYHHAKTDDIQAMTTIETWLQAFEPRPQVAAFLHNDYKFDNVVWTHDLTQIVGVLDWEMATVGDPLADLGAALAYWCTAEAGAFLKTMNLTHLKGCFNRQQVVAQYAALTGRDLSDIHFYYVFGLYKNAVIVQQIYARWKKGLTQDPRFAHLIHGVKDLSAMAIKAIETGNVD